MTARRVGQRQLRASLAHMAALNPVSVLYCHAPLNSGPDLLRQNIAYFDTLEQRYPQLVPTVTNANGPTTAPPVGLDHEVEAARITALQAKTKVLNALR